MVTLSFWFPLLFLSRVFASILVSDVYWGQGECDTAVDPFKNKKGQTPCTVVLALLVPCNVNVSESNTAEINKSACACNLEFYNLLSACAWFCIRKSVDPFYAWSGDCGQNVPLTMDYPYPTTIDTDIPSWAAKRLSSSGNFDPSAVTSGGWTTLQKVTPVIVGLGVLIVVGLIWCLCRAYKRRRHSRRAQGTFRHHRNQSGLSFSSTSHLNSAAPSQYSLPVHRIRFFFRGMFPMRGHRSPSWNIEGESGPSRPSAPYDPPSRPESGSSFTSVPSVHVQNDTPPISPEVTWSPFRGVSRWWSSISPTKGRDYQAVHLLSTRKNSKFGTDDDDHPEPAFRSSSPQNHASTPRNGRTSEDIPPVLVIPSEGEPATRSPTPQPETEPLSPKRSRPPSLRPNRPGHIVAVEDPSPSQPLPSANAPTTSSLTPNLSAFPPPPAIREQISSDSFYTSRTTLSTDQESEQTIKPRKLGPQHLFPPAVRAAGYSVPQRPADPVVKAWIPRPDGASNRPTNNPTTNPPSYDQANGSAPALPRPLSPTSIHPYPYTNHLRPTTELAAPGDSRSPRRNLQDLDTIDTQSETLLSRLSLAVNEPTSAPATSENGSVGADTDLFPASIIHESGPSKGLEYTPYPSSALLPLSATSSTSGPGQPPTPKR